MSRKQLLNGGLDVRTLAHARVEVPQKEGAPAGLESERSIAEGSQRHAQGCQQRPPTSGCRWRQVNSPNKEVVAYPGPGPHAQPEAEGRAGRHLRKDLWRHRVVHKGAKPLPAAKAPRGAGRGRGGPT